MKSGKINIGIVGGNFGSQVHLPAFGLDNRCEVLGIAGSTHERSKQLSAEYNLSKIYRSWEELVNDSEIDAISIAVPPSLQPAIALAAIGNGKAVYTDKPLAAKLEQAEVLYNLVNQKKLPNVVNFHLSTLNTWVRAKEMIASENIGQLQNIIFQFSAYAIPASDNMHWKSIKDRGAGTLFDFISHYFHALEWFVGPIAGLNAKLFSTINDNGPKRDLFNIISIEFISGAAATIIVNRTSVLNSGYKIEFSGTNGTLLLENKTRDVFGFNLFQATKSNNKLELVCASERPENQKFPDGRIYTTNNLITRFLDWIEINKPAKPSFFEGLRVQRLLEAAYTSDVTGQWVTL